MAPQRDPKLNPVTHYQTVSIFFQNGQQVSCVVPAFARWSEASTWGICQITLSDPEPLPEGHTFDTMAPRIRGPEVVDPEDLAPREP